MRENISYLIILLIGVFSGSVFAYTLDEVMTGVEKTTSNEYSLPYFQWMNKAEGQILAGYDPFEKKGIFGVEAGVQMFEKVDMQTRLSVSTDFSTQTDYQFSAGVSYNFLSTGESERRYKEAQRETVKRKLKAVDLFFDYLKKKVLLKTDDETDILVSTNNKLTQVDMAYISIKIEALSSLDSGEPQINGLSDYSPEKIDDDVVMIAIRRYLNLFNSDEDNSNSLYATFRTDYNSFLQGISAGVGGSADFEKPVAHSVQDKLDEIEIRKYKLMHDVIVEQLPILKDQYSELEKTINSSTTAIINGTLTTQQLIEIKKHRMDLEDRILELTIEAVKLEAIFKVLIGEL